MTVALYQQLEVATVSLDASCISIATGSCTYVLLLASSPVSLPHNIRECGRETGDEAMLLVELNIGVLRDFDCIHKPFNITTYVISYESLGLLAIVYYVWEHLVVCT